MQKIFIDHMDREVEITFPPRKIISLVPSQTELLFYLGLEKEVVGITKFCVHPKEQFRIKTRVGGTKKLNIKKIIELQPDLIIANKEENEKSQIEELDKHFPVWISDVRGFEDAIEMIVDVGDLCGQPYKANQLASNIRSKIENYIINHQLSGPPLTLRAAYFIWKDPYMVAGGNTFINSMMRLAGYENVFETQGRYPEITLVQLKKAKPEVILLSSEPYPFKKKHIPELQKACPEAVIGIVDGEMFSWYGNRLLQAADYFYKLNHYFGK